MLSAKPFRIVIAKTRQTVKKIPRGRVIDYIVPGCVAAKSSKWGSPMYQPTPRASPRLE